VRVVEPTSLQQRHQLADQLDAGRVTIDVGRVNDHLVDQRSGGFQRLGIVIG
jgi:hypothetical protein